MSERNPPQRGHRPPLAAAPPVAALITAADPGDPDSVAPLAAHIAAAVAEGMCGICLAPLTPVPEGTGIPGVAELACWSCRISWRPPGDLATEATLDRSAASLAVYVDRWREAVGLPGWGDG